MSGVLRLSARGAWGTVSRVAGGRQVQNQVNSGEILGKGRGDMCRGGVFHKKDAMSGCRVLWYWVLTKAIY